MLDERLRDHEQRAHARAWLYSTYARAAREHYAREPAPEPFAQPRLVSGASRHDMLRSGRRLLPRTRRGVFSLYELALLHARLFPARARLMQLSPGIMPRGVTHG